MNQDAIPDNQPISTRIPKENNYQEVEAGGHNKVRIQTPSQDATENVPKVLPPGTKIPDRAVKINPETDSAQRLADGVGSTAVGGSVESTLQGATSGDFEGVFGNPVGGLSSKEAHHPGIASSDDQKI